MIRKKWPNKVISDTGFSLELQGRHALVYREGDRRMTLNSERLSSDAGYVVYEESAKKWDGQESSEGMDEAKREQVLENVKEALGFLGINLSVTRSGLQPLVLKKH